MVDSQKIRYLIAGGWNTLFGYGGTFGLYYLLNKHVYTILIILIANFLAISMSFLTYKTFVFRTKGSWWKEYFRSYLVYGNMALASIGILWFMVDYMAIPFWIAQGAIMVITITLSYIGHVRFTFSNQS